jgi:SET domain-containing protein
MLENPQLYQLCSCQIGLTASSVEKIEKGTIIFEATGYVEDQASKYSVQIGEHEHFIAEGDLIYCNHSFSPNCRVKICETKIAIQMIAIRDIEPGEDITFNYNTTEWELSCPFEDRDTHKWVLGFKQLDEQERQEIWSLVSEWMKIKINAKITNDLSAVNSGTTKKTHLVTVQSQQH